MNTATIFAFATALFCGVVALAVVWNERRSVVHLAFVAGMVLLGLESIFSGLSWQAMAVGWTRKQPCGKWLTGSAASWAPSALLPGVWLFFALSYGRGNYREFLNRWKFLLLATFRPAAGAGRSWTMT